MHRTVLFFLRLPFLPFMTRVVSPENSMPYKIMPFPGRFARKT